MTTPDFEARLKQAHIQAMHHDEGEIKQLDGTLIPYTPAGFASLKAEWFSHLSPFGERLTGEQMASLIGPATASNTGRDTAIIGDSAWHFDGSEWERVK